MKSYQLTTMPSYWWECEACGTNLDFKQACESAGIAHYIWDILFPSAWDQANLVRSCKACNAQSLRIAYDFPRADKVTLRIVHLVGLKPYGIYLPMMWESYPVNSAEERWFDFKYVNGRSVYGLNKPAVFSREDLRKLFDLYMAKTGSTSFP